jgi:hypothetical protein
MAAKGTFAQYSGSLSDLPVTSSPGFLFLSLYLTGVDALDRSSAAARKLSSILSPNAIFTNNGGDPLSLSKMEYMFGQREGMLERFEHGGPIVGWDLEASGGERTVVCECASK